MIAENSDLFVDKHSIVRTIWGRADTVLFIFAGASAEFALNKAVDWLYFTGRLPADPLGRLFSTVSYAKTIVFSERHVAHRAIDAMVNIHQQVEQKRGAKIPDWAYRDVLFMLIDYSIRAYEALERELSLDERIEVFHVFYRLGSRMQINGLPATYREWEVMRQEHLDQNMIYSNYTLDLYCQYHKHLGTVRYHILLGVQAAVAPRTVRELLHIKKQVVLQILIGIYKISRIFKGDRLLKAIILPSSYKKQIQALDEIILT